MFLCALYRLLLNILQSLTDLSTPLSKYLSLLFHPTSKKPLQKCITYILKYRFTVKINSMRKNLQGLTVSVPCRDHFHLMLSTSSCKLLKFCAAMQRYIPASEACTFCICKAPVGNCINLKKNKKTNKAQCGYRLKFQLLYVNY